MFVLLNGSRPPRGSEPQPQHTTWPPVFKPQACTEPTLTCSNLPSGGAALPNDSGSPFGSEPQVQQTILPLVFTPQARSQSIQLELTLTCWNSSSWVVPRVGSPAVTWPASVKSLPLKSRCSRLARAARAAGIWPVSRLPLRSRYSRLARSARAGGISPLSRLPFKSRCSRLARLPNSAVISPVSRFPLRSRYSRLVRFARLVGISPVRRLLGSSSEVTRPSESVATPCHSARGRSVSHPLLSFQSGPPVASKKAVSA